MEKYVIIKNTKNRSTITFWRENQCGYTTNFELAGIYNGTERPEYPKITEENLHDMNLLINDNLSISNFYMSVSTLNKVAYKTTAMYFN